MKAKAVWKHGYGTEDAEILSLQTENASYNRNQQQAYYGGNNYAYDQQSYTKPQQYAGWSTIVIKEGQSMAIWDRDGVLKVVDGPKRVTLWRSYYQFLDAYDASPKQYLKIHHKDGTREHIRGPTHLWFDPANHKQISVGNLISLNSNEAMIVYAKAEKDDGKIKRRIVWGPTLYMPSPQEWLHTFKWGSAEDGATKTSFSKIKATPETMDVDVQYVRTSDDGNIDINLMVFFQLKDIPKMLDATSDPITDLMNAISSDVVHTISKISFHNFKSNTELLNTLKTYKETLEQAERIGYSIDKIVFKGFMAGEAINKMQLEGIATRTRLTTLEETEKQNQNLLDFKLEKEQERAAKKQVLELEQQKNKLQLRELELQHEAKEKQMQLDHQLAVQDAKTKAELSYLKSLKEMGVNLTSYLVAQNQAQTSSKVVKVQTGGNSVSDSIASTL